MSGKHVFRRFPAELYSALQAGEFAVRGRWTIPTLRNVEFPKDFEGFRETVSGHGQTDGRRGITMAGMVFSQGFAMVPICFLPCPECSSDANAWRA